MTTTDLSYRSWRRAAYLCPVMLAVCVAASGQTTGVPSPASVPDGPPNAVVVFRSGSFAVAPTFRVANVGVDSNVFNTSESETPDVTLTLEPGVDVGMRSPGLTLVGRAIASYVFYADQASERSLNPRGELEFEHRFSSRFSLAAEGSLGWSRTREGLEVDTRAETMARRGRVEGRIGSRRLQFLMHAAASDNTYDQNAVFRDVRLSETLNLYSRSGGVGVNYRLTPFTTLTADSELTADRFPNAPLRDTDSARVIGGFRLDSRALISGRAAIGYQIVRPLRTAEFRDLIANGGLSWQWHDRLVVSSGAERDVQYSYDPRHFFYTYNLGEVGVQQALWSSFDLGVHGSWTQMIYGRTPAQRLTGAPGDHEYLTEITLSTGMRVSRKVRFGVYVSQWERRAAQQGYTSLRSGLELTVGKARVNERGVLAFGPGR